eukprot:scaffold3009_cov108-Isochrysis_galbana.AAC.8
MVVEHVGKQRHRVGDQVCALDRQTTAHVSGSRHRAPLHSHREEVDVLQHGKHAPGAQDGQRMLLRQLLERMQRLLCQVDVLDGEQPLAEERHAIKVDDGGRRRWDCIHHVAQGARCQQHEIGVVLGAEHSD